MSARSYWEDDWGSAGRAELVERRASRVTAVANLAEAREQLSRSRRTSVIST